MMGAIVVQAEGFGKTKSKKILCQSPKIQTKILPSAAKPESLRVEKN
jgi:hypothetical protein